MLKNIDHKNVIHYGKDAIMVLSRKDDYSGSTCLKVLNEEFPSAEQLAHLENEFSFGTLGNLHCVRKAIEKKQVENHQAVVFEYVEGVNLQRYLTGQQLNFSQKLNLASELTAAVADIQKENIFHGQLCLENILVEKGTEKIFLIDFSEACYQDNANMEMPAQKKFKPAMLPYLAPEQSGRINRSIDARADLYSLGVLLYRIFTGQVPFSGADTMELMYSHMARIPASPASVAPDLPELVSQIIMKLLAKNAEDRYQSAFGVHYDIEHCAAEWHAKNALPHFELGTNDFSGRFYPHQKLYGREMALKTLFSVFEESAAGNKRMLMVSGYSGSGKSSLITEVQQPVIGEKGLFITGKFDPLQTDAPYSGFVQAFTELSNHILAETPALQQDWKERIRKDVGVNGGLLSDMVPGIGALIGVQEEVPELKGTEAQNRFRYTLLNFIKASARQDQPLVIFLDDLQWADDSSLNLLMVLMEEHALRHFMIIGAFRSNEVGEDHALTKLFKTLKDEGIYYDEISLGELAAADVLRLVEDMLHTGQKDAAELAEIVYTKTKGNAFYVQQFLRSVYEEKLLFFDFEQRKWIWKKELISEMNVSGNVVDLMTSLVKRLPAATIQLLKTASCIGNRFEKRILSIAGEVSEKQVQQLLSEPLSDGLVLGGGTQFKFAHDRIQQSVYSLMDEDEKKQLHLRIGKAWSSITLETELADRIFDIVNQWNIAAELVDSDDTRFYLAGLNLIAARKAIVTTAYSQALQYYEKSLSMVDESYWTTHYSFALDLTAESAEAAYLCGEFGKVDGWVQTILQKSKSLTDLTKGYEISIKKLIAQNKLQDAIRLGLTILEKMGVRFPLHPAKATTLSGLLLTKWAIRGKDADYFTSLPEMTDQEKNAMMRILSDISSAAYFAAPDLVPLLIFKMIRLTVQHGISRKSPYSFAAYGFILSAHMRETDNGIKYGQVALNMARQLRADELNGSILTINNVFLKHWRKPLRDTFQDLEEAFAASLTSGDHEWGSYAAQNMAYQLFVAGYPLKELAKKTLLLDQQIEKFRQALTIRRLRLFRQSIHNLTEPTASPETLKGEIFNEEELTEADISENNKVYFHNLYFQKAFLALVFNETDHAAAFMAKAGHYLESVRGSSLYPLFYFYQSLVITGHGARKLSGNESAVLQKNIARMKQYEKFCPQNYQHKRLLLEAEYARVKGDHTAAKLHYDAALKAATEQGMLHDLAFCWERAAMFFIDTHEEVLAKFYLQNAYKTYQQWGATTNCGKWPTGTRNWMQIPWRNSMQKKWSGIKSTWRKNLI
jgi:histidine kinase